MNRYTQLDEIFARTYTATTSRTLLNFNVIGQRSRSFLLVDQISPNYFHVSKILVDNAVFRLSIA